MELGGPASFHMLLGERIWQQLAGATLHNFAVPMEDHYDAFSEFQDELSTDAAGANIPFGRENCDCNNPIFSAATGAA